MNQILKKRKKQEQRQEVSYYLTERINKKVISEILEVERSSGLTAENLLNKARRKESSLHNFFDWDNHSAAEKWRKFQARMLINEVRLTIGDKKLFAFENVSVSIGNGEKEETERQYKQIVEIMGNDEYKRQQLEVALANLTYWQHKYEDLKELNPVFKVLEVVKKKWQKKKQ